MMKNYRIFLTVIAGLLILGITTSFAEYYFSIESISVSFDSITNKLHIEAVHHSKNQQMDYVNNMKVNLNDQQVDDIDYKEQQDPDLFTAEVPLNAQVGDVISVQLSSSGESSITQDLTVGNVQVSESRSTNKDTSFSRTY